MDLKKIKITALILAVLMTAAMLSGCGKDAAEQDYYSVYSGKLDENGRYKGVKALKYVTLPDYTKIEVPKEEHAVSDEEIDEEVTGILSYFADSEKVYDKAVENLDYVNIDYVGKIDGVEFDGGNTRGAGTEVQIGVTQYIDDFLEQLISHKPGETFDIEVTFPDNYHEQSLRGKDAVFTVTINYIKGDEILPDLTDAFVSANLAPYYGWETVDEMREGISSDISEYKTAHYIEKWLTENAQIKKVPKALTEYQEDLLGFYYADMAKDYEMTADEYVKQATGLDSLKALLKEAGPEIDYYSRYYLVIQAIAEDQDIVADDSDIAQYVKDVFGSDSADDFIGAYGLPYAKLMATENIINNMLRELAVKL